MKDIQTTPSQRLREIAYAQRLTYDKTAGTSDIFLNRHKLVLSTDTFVKANGIQDFVELARQLDDGSKDSDYNAMKVLFAPWWQVLEFQNLKNDTVLTWKSEFHTPQDMHANQFVSLFDFLAWLNQEPSSDP